MADGADGAIALTSGGLGSSSPTPPPAVMPEPDETAPATGGWTAGKASGRSSNNESGARPSNDDTINVVPGPPSVEITKTTDAPAGGMNPGDSFSFTITFSNVSDHFVLRNVVIDDTVPAGLTISSFSGPNCSMNGQAASCAVGELDLHTAVTVTINVMATADACPSVTNQATVTHEEGSAESNPVTVTVDCVEGGVVTPTPTPTVGGVAFTGAGSAGLGLLALALLVLGSGLLYLGRRTLGDSDA